MVPGRHRGCAVYRVGAAHETQTRKHWALESADVLVAPASNRTSSGPAVRATEVRAELFLDVDLAQEGTRSYIVVATIGNIALARERSLAPTLIWPTTASPQDQQWQTQCSARFWGKKSPVPSRRRHPNCQLPELPSREEQHWERRQRRRVVLKEVHLSNLPMAFISRKSPISRPAATALQMTGPPRDPRPKPSQGVASSESSRLVNLAPTFKIRTPGHQLPFILAFDRVRAVRQPLMSLFGSQGTAICRDSSICGSVSLSRFLGKRT